MSTIAEASNVRASYRAATVLIVGLFLMWGIANSLNDVLIAQFKKAFRLSDFESGLVQSAFYVGYFCFAIPASLFMRRFGYRAAVILGLLLYGTGALLFYPAAQMLQYGYFLAALFVIASGLAFLETSANPLMTVMGPPQDADRRLNFAQSFNPLGAITGVALGSHVIFSDVQLTPEYIATLSEAELAAAYATEAHAVQLPYLALGIFVLIWAGLVALVAFPRVDEPVDAIHRESVFKNFQGLRRFPHFWFGVIAQFFYVGAQVGVWSYLIRYTQHNLPGTTERSAAQYLTMSLVLFMLGRFIGTALMNRFSAATLMVLFAAAGAALCGLAAAIGGEAGLWALVAVSFFMSIMFPTIFSLSLRGLGLHTKAGSSLLVMAIVGGAALTAIMGRISDASSINTAVLVPTFSFLVVLSFALRTVRADMATQRQS
jgi:FHS family L-fucose permease-like MFS transporter